MTPQDTLSLAPASPAGATEAWRAGWRTLAAVLPAEGVEELLHALERDDAVLTQLPHLRRRKVAGLWEVVAANPLVYALWKGDGLPALADRWYCFERAHKGPVGDFLAMWEHTPRRQARALLAGEIRGGFR